MHDLSDDPKAVERAANAARTALGSYGDMANANIDLLNVSENATFLVTLPNACEQFIMRVHRFGYHSEVEIRSELAWAEALALAEGIRTPSPILNRAGAQVTSVFDSTHEIERHCVLFNFLPGAEAVPENLVGGFETLGSLTAKMHRHSRNWTRPAWFKRFDWNYAAAFGEQARWGRWRDGLGVEEQELELLTTLEATLKKRLRSYGEGPERYGLIHADMRLANLLWTSDQDVSVIDFDDCGQSWYFYDLGSALSFIEDDPKVPELISSWFDGYRQVMPIKAEDEAEIWTFILFRRLLLLAWVGSHQGAEIARELGGTFTSGTCDLAEGYLSVYS